MHAGQYIVTTLSNSFGKFAPWVAFIVVGYLVFIKLPFLVMFKVHKENKKESNPEGQNPSLSTPDLRSLQQKVRLEQQTHQEKIDQKASEFKERQKQEEKKQKTESKKEEKKEEKREEKKQQKSSPSKDLSEAEVIFEIKSGQKLSKSELKKRYHELLKQNHPDKVASLGSDFKKLAERKTKDINQAYERLKSKAS